jgi:hypothetical protein
MRVFLTAAWFYSQRVFLKNVLFNQVFGGFVFLEYHDAEY